MPVQGNRRMNTSSYMQCFHTSSCSFFLSAAGMKNMAPLHKDLAGSTTAAAAGRRGDAPVRSTCSAATGSGSSSGVGVGVVRLINAEPAAPGAREDSLSSTSALDEADAVCGVVAAFPPFLLLCLVRLAAPCCCCCCSNGASVPSAPAPEANRSKESSPVAASSALHFDFLTRLLLGMSAAAAAAAATAGGAAGG